MRGACWELPVTVSCILRKSYQERQGVLLLVALSLLELQELPRSTRRLQGIACATLVAYRWAGNKCMSLTFLLFVAKCTPNDTELSIKILFDSFQCQRFSLEEKFKQASTILVHFDWERNFIPVGKLLRTMWFLFLLIPYS